MSGRKHTAESALKPDNAKKQRRTSNDTTQQHDTQHGDQTAADAAAAAAAAAPSASALPPPRSDVDDRDEHKRMDNDTPQAELAIAPAASAAASPAAVSLASWLSSLPLCFDAAPSHCWRRAIPSFLPYALDQIARHSDLKLQDACTPVFTLCGCRWQIQLYANRIADRAVGIFLKYCGSGGGGGAGGAGVPPQRSPPVVFRICVFHRDVVAETDAINARRKLMHDAQVELQATEAASTPPHTVHLTPPGKFVPTAYPTHDPRNLGQSIADFRSFNLHEDIGFTYVVPHTRLAEFCCGSNQSLHLCVVILSPSQAWTRTLSSLKESYDVKGRRHEQLPYFGLKARQGASSTNSYLQSMFHLPAVRQSLYKQQTSADQLVASLRAPSSRCPCTLTRRLVLLASALDATGAAANMSLPATLSVPVPGIHNAEELMSVLDSDHLEPVEYAMRPLFQGIQEVFVDGISVPFACTRMEQWRDIPLDIAGTSTLMQALAKYMAEFIHEGPHQFDAVDVHRSINLGKQDARSTLRFVRFPPILQLQMTPLQHDDATDAMKPVTDRFEFPAVLDLQLLEWGYPKLGVEQRTRPRAPPDPLNPAIYHLHSVLVQPRSADDGSRHCTFTRPFLASLQQRRRDLDRSGVPLTPADLESLSAEYDRSPFFKFEDETVSVCTDPRAAVEMNFGSYMAQMAGNQRVTVPSSGLVHMLVYVRRSLVCNAGVAQRPYAAGFPTAGDASSAPAHVHSSCCLEEPKLNQAAAPQAKSSAAASSSSNRVASAAVVPSLMPAVVPCGLRSQISAATGLYLEHQDAMQAEALRCQVRVICEWDLVWCGVRDEEAASPRPTGGLAGPGFGLKTTSIRESLIRFKQPRQVFSILKANTLTQLRTILAMRFGLATGRLQLWLVEGRHYTLLTDLGKSIASLRTADHPTPSVFVRDAGAIDTRDGLKHLPSLSFGASGERRLMLFKHFDVSRQQLRRIGSAEILTASTLADLHQFAAALLQSKHGLMHAVGTGPPPTLVASFSQMSAAPAPARARVRADSDDDLMQDADAAAAASSASASVAPSQSLSAPHSELTMIAASIGAPNAVAGSLEEYSLAELHWHDWKCRHPARAATVATQASIDAACLRVCPIAWPAAGPLRVDVEPSGPSAWCSVPNDPARQVTSLSGHSIVLSHSVPAAFIAKARAYHRKRLTAWITALAAGQRSSSVDIPPASFHASAQSYVRSLQQFPFEPPRCRSEIPTRPASLLRASDDALQCILRFSTLSVLNSVLCTCRHLRNAVYTMGPASVALRIEGTDAQLDRLLGTPMSRRHVARLTTTLPMTEHAMTRIATGLPALRELTSELQQIGLVQLSPKLHTLCLSYAGPAVDAGLDIDGLIASIASLPGVQSLELNLGRAFPVAPLAAIPNLRELTFNGGLTDAQQAELHTLQALRTGRITDEASGAVWTLAWSEDQHPPLRITDVSPEP